MFFSYPFYADIDTFLDKSPSAFLSKLALDISTIFLSILTTALLITSFSGQAKSSLEGLKETFSFVSNVFTGISISERFTDPKYLFISSLLLVVEGRK